MVEMKLEDIKKHIEDNLRTLASNSEDQVKALMPGCPMCDLFYDYELAIRYVDENPDKVDTNTKRVLKEVLNEVDVASKHHECGDLDDLKKPKWEKVRLLAKQAMKELGIEDAPLKSFEEIEPGVWQKKF